MIISGFDWDDGNRKKSRKHGLNEAEIEAFFRQKELYVGPDLKHSSHEHRFYAAGRTPSGKPALVIFTFRDGYIRPISARYMHEKEAKRYQKIASHSEE